MKYKLTYTPGKISAEGNTPNLVRFGRSKNNSSVFDATGPLLDIIGMVENGDVIEVVKEG